MITGKAISFEGRTCLKIVSMLRPYIFLLFILFSCLTGTAQNVAWQWAKYCPNAGDGRGRSITTDAAGNIYTTGMFHGGIRADTTSVYGPGNADAYIAKFNSQGDLSWIKWLGGKGNDVGNCIVADKNDNVYVCGSFSDTAYFGQTYLVSKGNSDIFLAKLNAAGDLVWIKAMGSTLPDAGTKLTLDVNSNIFITGYFGSSAAIPPVRPSIQFDNKTLTSRGNSDAFIAKYRADGDLLWVKNIGSGSNDDAGTSVTCDANGSVYLASSFSGYYTYIDTLLVDNPLYSFVSNSICLTKFDSNGYLEWYKLNNGGASVGGGGCGGSVTITLVTEPLITTDESDNVYLTGVFRNCFLSFGPANTVLANDNQDIFIAKYSSAGNLQWARKGNPPTTSSFNNEINGICSSGDHIFVAGKHNGQILIAGYDKIGNRSAFDTFGTGPYAKDAADICVAPNGHFYVTGAVTTNTYLDNIPIGNLDNNSNMFLGQLHVFPTSVSTVSVTKGEVIVYPVPSEGTINIAFQSNIFSTIQICNITGQTIKSLLITPGETLKTIDMMNVPSGVYTAVLTGDGVQETRKIVIAK